MKVFGKSFLGAILGTIFVLLIVFLFTNSFSEKNDKNDKSYNEYQPISQGIQNVPVQKANYAVPQSIDFTEAAEKTVNAVVHIKTEMQVKTNTYDDFFGPFRYYFGNPNHSNTFVAFGSGVIISPDGYIVTNNHVVEGADRITVTLNNKDEREATIVGTDPTTDLALIKIDEDNLVYLNYGNSDNVKVGEWVLAVGNPFNLTSTVTAGIVSAKARNINILGAASAIESFIQTDAVVNRGNSGGALVNTRGELIGINAAIASHTGVYEGYSFAIPVNIVSKVVGDLMKYGEIQRAYIGVQIRDIDADFAEELGLDHAKGVYVAGVVEKGGAEEAGLKEGDVILAINGKETNTLSALMGTIAQHSPGEVVHIDVNRKNKMMQFDVTLKNQENTTALVKTEDSFFNKMLGASLQKINSSETSNMGINSGLKIVNIEDGILRRGGISEGFIITEINGLEVDSKTSLERAMQSGKDNYVRLKGIYPNGTRVSYEFML
jgi:serine protease Do